MSVPSSSRDDIIFGKKEKKKEPAMTPEVQQDLDSLSSSSPAEDFKAVGNRCFSGGYFSAAIKCYTSAIERDPQNEVLHSNRSASYLQSVLLAGPSLALKDAEKAIALKPGWFKAYLRKGDALFAMKKFEQARDVYQHTLSLNPECATAAESIHHCNREILLSSSPDKQPQPESAPYNAETHRAEHKTEVSREEQKAAEEGRIGPEQLIKTWSQDILVEEGRTACKKHGNVSVGDADRQAGQACKEQLLNSFRQKLQTDDAKRRDLAKKREEELLAGGSFNYRQAPDAKSRTLSKGTDSVGMAISADAYKAYAHKSQEW
jgi:tetratricopeptide (TPR) repeat protein